MCSKEAKDPRYKIVCVQHGVLSDRPKDWIAADLVKREHQEQCPGDCEVFEPGSDEFESAAALEDDGDQEEIECRREDCFETFGSEAAMFGHLATHADRRGEKA